MKFTDMLQPKEKFEFTVQKPKEELLLEVEKNPEEILRAGGYKIKLVTGTAFGTQVDFAKKYTDEEIEKILKDFKIKIKGKSVFIVD